MAPFDVTYAHEFLIQEEYASSPQHQPAGMHGPSEASDSSPWAPSSPGFPLIDRSAVTASTPRSMHTPSYVEFLLQVIDKDSVMTGVLVIAAYVKLMLVLSN